MESPATPSWSAPYRLRVAARLLRARKINIISVLGVTLGVASIIVVMAVMDGFQRELRQMIRGTLSDLIIEIDAPSDAYPELVKAVEAIDGVTAATVQRQTFGLIPIETRESDGGRQNFLPVRVVAIVPDEERRVSNVLDYVQGVPGQPENPFEINQEEWTPEGTPRVVISHWLARRLGYVRYPLGVGDDFTLITFDKTGENGRAHYVSNEDDVIVSRVYESGNREFDKLHLYVDLTSPVVQETFFRLPEGSIAELRIRLDDYGRAEELQPAIAAAVGRFDRSVAANPDVRIDTWEDRQHMLLLAVNNEKFLLAFVLFFIVLVACFTIFATLTMTVVEKTRDIGVLRALGATPGGILSIFMLNGTLVGGLGAGLGYALGQLVAANVNPIRVFLKDTFGWEIFPADIYLFETIPTYVDQRAALGFALGAALSAALFAIVPAVRAARLRPVNALRYE